MPTHQALARWVSENQKLKIFYLLQVAGYLANGGSLDGDKLLSISAWQVQLPTDTGYLTLLTAAQAMHNEVESSTNLGPFPDFGTNFSQCGINHYRQSYQISYKNHIDMLSRYQGQP